MEIRFERPAVSLRRKLDGDGYFLSVVDGENSVVFDMTIDEVRLLGLSCARFAPVPELPRVADDDLAPVRALSSCVLGMDDRSVQALLRETQSDVLLSFMWVCADEELAKRFFSNMSQRAAQMLFEDLSAMVDSFGGPSEPRNARRVVEACRCAVDILSSARRLVSEGAIPPVEGLPVYPEARDE